ncbi:MAG: Uncharacterized protein FD162_2227 [Rhodobacteraceae bacterium]|uniref:hypothetical protein n=1 Tax=Cypionkella sp. TaxID=2811411 RepID=UPI001327A416|nr:hypothetical protein [Cypionkella sp.]KAF0172637.1 MAG: Uncharacterized protein FD162_2227 [Paracoccaceae bacterium]MDO8325967.1 hypothetical protein [Cypionkella sp.]
MNGLAMFLGMSLSFGGVGGLLSGIFARSFRRAMLWAVGFGILDTVLLAMVSPTSRFAPGLVLIAVFWGLVGWFAVGRFSARRRASKAAAIAATTK